EEVSRRVNNHGGVGKRCGWCERRACKFHQVPGAVHAISDYALKRAGGVEKVPAWVKSKRVHASSGNCGLSSKRRIWQLAHSPGRRVNREASYFVSRGHL